MSAMSETMPANFFQSDLWALVASTKLEIIMFLSAMVVYAMLNMHRAPKLDQKRGKSNVKPAKDSKQLDETCDNVEKRRANTRDRMDTPLRNASDISDCKAVLERWTSTRNSPQACSNLPDVVEAMQRCKKDNAYIIRELRTYFEKHSNQRHMSLINDILEPLGRRMDSQLMDLIVQILPSLGLKRDQRTFEIFLSMHLTTRKFEEVSALICDMKESKVAFSAHALLLAMKAALRKSDFDEALQYFRDLKKFWMADSTFKDSPSQAPRHIVSQLIELSCKERQLQQLVSELCGFPIGEDSIHAMLSECVRLRDSQLSRQVYDLAMEQTEELSDATYGLLIKALVAEPAAARSVIKKISETKGENWSPDIVSAVLGFCAKTSDFEMANQIFDQTKPHSLNVLSSFIRFYLEVGHDAKACAIFEKYAQNSADESGNLPRGSMVDARLERSLMNAALRCGHSSLANQLLEGSPSDIAKHITMIQNCAAGNNLKGAFRVFESLERSGVDLNSVVYNTILEACVQCRDLRAAENWMEKTKEAGMADVVSFNTLIKAHLWNHKHAKARSLMDEMKNLGLQPNRVTYNELINSAVAAGKKDDMWDIVREMKEAGIPPNQVTCSILLKNLNARSHHADVSLTMDLLNSMEEQMDEVLLSSVVEACVRVGKPDLLAEKLTALQGRDQISINGAHTYGSLIKAYGHAHDIDGVWRCWKEMRSRHIKPSSITLGCMVEAVVSNGDSEGAYDLMQSIQDDDNCKAALNSVIYCSILKGFTREKKLDRVWAVYSEMCKKGIDTSIVVYNTMIDACARAGRMESVPELMQDMKRHRIQPNLITFSTMIKGHSQAGDIQSAFSLVEQMKNETSLKPDEIMYNSLLDGCAQHCLVAEGLRLLDEMQEADVQPSNFTLSVLVKLMNRSRKVDKAFEMVHDISRKYNFKPNVHVYTNLIQACISARQLSRAMDTLDAMVKAHVVPESRTYSLLVRASMSSNLYEQAAALLRGALGLPGAHHVVARAACPNLDYGLVSETLNSLVDKGFAQLLAAPLLNDVKAQKPRVRIDAYTQKRVTSSSSKARA
jgi:pentatricopeptide repeat protein